MAVMYQQLQQQQQHIQQQIVTPQQQLVSLSMNRTRECDDRTSRSPSNSQANGGLDSRLVHSSLGWIAGYPKSIIEA